MKTYNTIKNYSYKNSDQYNLCKIPFKNYQAKIEIFNNIGK